MQQLSRRKRFKQTTAGDLQVHPQKLSFDHFQISKTHVNKFTIRNRSLRRQPLKIISKDEKNAPFIIQYDKKKEIESNEEVNVTVYFKPLENRFFSQNLEVMLGNNLDKVQLTAFSMPIKKRSSKIHNRDKIDFNVEPSQSQDEMSYEENAESSFQRRCNELKNYRVDKQINYEKSIGNEEPCYDQKQNIKVRRKNEDEIKLEQKHKNIRTRFSLQHSKECPIHDRGTNKIISWNEEKNNTNMMLKFSVKKFQSLISKIIKDERFDRVRKILTYYMQLQLPKEKVFERMQNQSKHSIKDKYNWKKGEKSAISQPIQFSKFSVTNKVMASQYDNLSSMKFYHFDVDPRVSFDDWIPVQEIAENGYEMMGYEYMNEPPFISHQSQLHHKYRHGAYEQHPFIQNIFEKSQIEYPIFNPSDQSYPYHTFKKPQFYQSTKCLQLQQLALQSIQEFSDHPFISSTIFNGLNYQTFHYLKLDIETKYDVGFFTEIEKDCDHLIGGVELEDRIEQNTNFEYCLGNRRSSQKMEDMRSTFHKYKREKEEKCRRKGKEKEKVSDYQFMTNIEFSLGEFKKEGLMEISTLVNGCNKLIENKQLKMLF